MVKWMFCSFCKFHDTVLVKAISIWSIKLMPLLWALRILNLSICSRDFSMRSNVFFLRHERQFLFLTFFTRTWHHQIKPNRCAAAHEVCLNLLYSAWEHAVCVLIYSFHCCPLLDVTQSLISNIFNNLFPGKTTQCSPGR